MMGLYKGRFRAEGIEKFNKVAAKARSGKMTFRQAVALDA